MPTPRALLAWYDRHRRDLPWRRTSDPYRIWVSEVMLQQTRVETVLPYYRRFLARFPTVAALAAAAVDELLALWSGLGYYRRGRQLHAAARRIVAAGGFPRTVAGLKALPGIGDYTAAAVASIAFGVAVPVLDGNVERLLCRLGAAVLDPHRREGRQRLLAAAAALLDPDRPGDSNQAMMELGATLCTPRRPRCLLCPLAAGCRGRAAGEPERFAPVRQRRPPVRQRRLVALVARGERLLLFRRPEASELLAGTWELPWAELAPGPEPPAAERRRAAAGLAARYGGRWRVGDRLAAVRHGITFRAIAAEVHRCRLAGGEGVGEGLEAGWFAGGEIAGLPLSSLVTKVLAAVEEAASAASALVGEAAAAAGEDEPAGDLVVDLPQPLGHQRAEDLQQP
jgi:A/G-specific adenine glycosylase